MLEGFERRAFEQADEPERQALCDRLAVAISERIRAAPSFFECIPALVEELRAAGHDLWSYDSDGEGWEVWCPNWAKPTGPGIFVVFRAEGPSEVGWTRH
jgi:hypothetical protein